MLPPAEEGVDHGIQTPQFAASTDTPAPSARPEYSIVESHGPRSTTEIVLGLPSHEAEMRKLQQTDVKHRLCLRIALAIAMLVLLGIQNCFVFNLFTKALNSGSVKDVQGLFSVLIGATLTETYLTIRMIVKAIFHPIEDYPDSKKTKKAKSALEQLGINLGEFKHGFSHPKSESASDEIESKDPEVE